jgi:hypothetical protein
MDMGVPGTEMCQVKKLQDKLSRLKDDMQVWAVWLLL